MTAAEFNSVISGGRGITVPVGIIGSVSFDAAAASAIGSGATGNIVVTAERLTNVQLPAAQIGRPVIELRVTAGGLAAGEDADSIVVYHLDAANNLRVVRSYFGAGRVVFATGSFSRFVIGHNNQISTFNDALTINNHWGRPHISFVTARELYRGHAVPGGARRFSPDGTMTRAEFVAVLRNYDGTPLNQAARSNFADVADGRWYTPVIAWGEAAGIFGTGIGTNFNPNAAITRADMAFWLHNYANNRVVLESVRSLSFSDIGNLSPEYRAAINSLANADVISGYGEGAIREYRPDNTSTRAEVAAIVAQFVRAFR
jgi:hypothetical protein